MAKANFGQMRRILTNLSLGINIPVAHPLCNVSPPRGAGGGGGYAGVGGGTHYPPPQSRQRKRRPTAKKTSALEEAAVGTVGERGGRPGPHPKPNKGWGPSGTSMRRVPLGLVGYLGGGG